MTYGEYRRAKQRVNVLPGYEGNEPDSLTFSAKTKAAEAILSGMLISLDSNQFDAITEGLLLRPARREGGGFYAIRRPSFDVTVDFVSGREIGGRSTKKPVVCLAIV
jgi:hypothetical protein